MFVSMQELVTACKANLLGMYCTVDRTEDAEYAGRQEWVQILKQAEMEQGAFRARTA